MTDRELLDARYGRTPERRLRGRVVAIAAAALGVALVGAWVAWAGILSPSDKLDWRDLGYEDITDRGLTVGFEVTAPVGAPVSCLVEAQDSTGAINGWKLVELPGSELGVTRYSEALRTTSEPVVGLINRCWLT